MKDYEVIIGLEVHAELSTKTKIYCGCKTEFGGEPNTHCCPVCTGMPGALPVLNKRVVEYAIKAGLAMNCEIARDTKQDRKNYFYPDLPKSYQISQFDMPLCKDGYLNIQIGEKTKKIGITRIHIEEDAGKLNHDDYASSALIDLNRACVPLIEIVSEPDIRSAEEAKLYVEKIKEILEYLEVCDCKMQEGSLRADVNLSVRKIGETKFRTRTETKNLNSFKSIVRCIEFETKRQIEELKNGGTIYQETRRWDDDRGIGYAMREKENAHDYRYFPEPDLSLIKLSDDYINELKGSLPETKESRINRYINDYSLPKYDAEILTSSKYLSDFFEDAAKISKNIKSVSNWIMSDFIRLMGENELEYTKMPFQGKNIAKLVELIDSGKISSAIAKKVFEEMFKTGKNPESIVEEQGLIQISDEGEIKTIVLKILENNPESIKDYKAGRDRALGFLVGQAMKETKGKANPQLLNKLFLEELNK